MCSLVMSPFSRDFIKIKIDYNQSIRLIYHVYSIHTAPGRTSDGRTSDG